MMYDLKRYLIRSRDRSEPDIKSIYPIRFIGNTSND